MRRFYFRHTSLTLVHNQFQSSASNSAFILLGLLVAACSTDTVSRRAADPIVRDSAGVTIVENSEAQWETGAEWYVGSEITSIGSFDGDPKIQLFQAWDATRLSNGDVVIANSGTSELKFFSREGEFLRSVGRSGGGPGEFLEDGSLRTLQRLPGDTVFAWDLYGQTVSVFDNFGRYIRSARLQNTNRMYFMSDGGGVLADGSQLLCLFNPTMTEPNATGLTRMTIRLVRFNPSGDSLNTVGEFPDTETQIQRQPPSGLMSRTPRFAKETTFRVSTDRVYVATGDSYEIRVLDTDGSLMMLVRKQYYPIVVTDRLLTLDVEGEHPRAVRKPNRTGRRTFRDIEGPKQVPPYQSIVVDSESNLWVEEYRFGEKLSYTWSVFDRDGVWLGTMKLPIGFEPYEIGADYVLGREEDALDVEYIKVYELVKP